MCCTPIDDPDFNDIPPWKMAGPVRTPELPDIPELPKSMNIYAIADLHLSYKSNREDWAKLQPRPDDGLIIAGDIGESVQVMKEAFQIAKDRFKMVWWVPGNHELYSSQHSKEDEMHLRGESKYMACVIAARQCGVLTPEDDFATVMYTSPEGVQEAALICPIFTLYDYSFRPADVSRENALAWAEEKGIKATDEVLLHPDPYDSRDEWCSKLVQQAELKLQAACETGLPLVIINHWPLREDTVYIPAVPRFSLWCGTQKTHNWHTRFNAKVVVTGHLHVRRTDWIDGVRFEEVSLGYPRQWQDAKNAGNDVNTMLREILPGPPTPEIGQEPPTNFRRLGWGWS